MHVSYLIFVPNCNHEITIMIVHLYQMFLATCEFHCPWQLYIRKCFIQGLNISPGMEQVDQGKNKAKAISVKLFELNLYNYYISLI